MEADVRRNRCTDAPEVVLQQEVYGLVQQAAVVADGPDLAAEHVDQAEASGSETIALTEVWYCGIGYCGILKYCEIAE